MRNLWSCVSVTLSVFHQPLYKHLLVKPFESQIHVCVVLNCTIPLTALGIWIGLELSDDMVLLKTHCWGDALSVFLLCLFWCFIMESLCCLHNKWEALERDYVLSCFSSLMVSLRVTLQPCTPERFGVVGQLAASLFLPDYGTMLSMETKITRNESVFLPKSKEYTCLMQGNGRRKEFKLLSHVNLNEWTVSRSFVLSDSLQKYPGLTDDRSLLKCYWWNWGKLILVS